MSKKFKFFMLYKLFSSLIFTRGIFLLFLLQEKNMTFLEVATYQAIFFVSTTLFEIPTGVIGDKFGKVNSLLIGSILLTLLVLMMNILIPPGIVFSDEINGSDVPAASSELPKDQANASDTTSDASTSSELPKDQSNASDTTYDASTNPDLSKNQTNVSDAPSTSEDASDKKADAIQNNTDASASNGEETIISRVTYNANAGRNSGVVKMIRLH